MGSSAVNVANFVTVKPGLEREERRNFKIWKKQMTCMLLSQDMLGFVEGQVPPPPPPPESDEQQQWRRSDGLVRGWILGSIGRDVLGAVWDKPTAREIWIELDNIFNEKEEEENNGESSGDFSRYLPLYKAAQRGDWDTAKSFFQDSSSINELGTTIISSDLETALHVSVLTGKANDLVNKLVEITPREALAIKDIAGDTALHNAAIVGNTSAAVAIVAKNPDLLYISSKNNRLPIQKAVANCRKETLEYLISEHEANAATQPLFEGQIGVMLLTAIIACEFVDIALSLAHKYPMLCVLKKDDDYRSALSTLAQTSTLFPRTEYFSWWQKFVYHCTPVNYSKSEVDAQTTSNTDIENSSTNAAEQTNTSSHIISTGKFLQFPLCLSTSIPSEITFFSVCCWVDLHSIGRKVESVIWYIIKHLVPKAKELRKIKTMHQQALELVEYLCNQIVSELPEREAGAMFRKSMLQAAEHGNSEIVEIIIRSFPMVAMSRDMDTGRNIFLLAAGYRYENVINLIYNMSDRKYIFFDSTDKDGNNLLHICGKLAPPHRLNLVAGAALQMQRELQWFKEMENFVHPSRRSWSNKDRQTPQMLFTAEHGKLKADGEKWMKDTATASSITAALIATVMIAAVFTVPGGINSETGTPLFTGRVAFELFAASVAISLFTTVTSLLMFLSILTARYAEEDFLYILPYRLSLGLFSLFVSITFMLVAFSATFYLVLERDAAWLVALLALACLPVASFVLLQFPLLVDVVYTTYGPGIFGKKGDSIIY